MFRRPYPSLSMYSNPNPFLAQVGYRSNKAGGTYCQDTIESYVRNAYPSYCQAYFDHDWTTAADAVKFVGKEKKGGKWVNVH